MPTPMVSVVIACRNAERTLGVQLTALAEQECPVPWNVVVSDNGSTDGTVALARRYAERLPGLVVVDSSDRAGPGHARNVGAQATQAPLLVFCDADDKAGTGWLAALVAALEQDRFVAGRLDALALNSSRTLRSRRLQQTHGLQESPFGPGLPHAGANNLGVDREVFLAVGGFDPAVGCLEDTDLCWRIQLSGTRLRFAPTALMHVRLRSSWASMWAQGHDYGAAAALLTERYARFGQPGRSGAPNHSTGAPRPAGGRSPFSRFWGTSTAIWSLLRSAPSVGWLLWKLGWHLGHRRFKPTDSARPALLEQLSPQFTRPGHQSADAA